MDNIDIDYGLETIDPQGLIRTASDVAQIAENFAKRSKAPPDAAK